MTQWPVLIFSFFARIPVVARVRVYMSEIPRAIRTWFVMLLCMGVLMVLLSVYSVYLFFTYAYAEAPEPLVPNAIVSVNDVQIAVQRIRDRDNAFKIPQVVDPSR